MSFAFARARYRQADTAGLPEVQDPYEIVAVTLRELENSLGVLQMAEQGARAADQHVARALKAIYILQSSLDFEKGGDVAPPLFQVYEYARQQVLRFLQRDQAANLPQARDAIAEIRSAWGEIGSEVRGTRG